jgi:hypothetical protein
VTSLNFSLGASKFDDSIVKYFIASSIIANVITFTVASSILDATTKLLSVFITTSSVIIVTTTLHFTTALRAKNFTTAIREDIKVFFAQRAPLTVQRSTVFLDGDFQEPRLRMKI